MALPAGFQSSTAVSSPGWTPLAVSTSCRLAYQGNVLDRPVTPVTYRQASALHLSSLLPETWTKPSPTFNVLLTIDPVSIYMADGPLGVNAVARDVTPPTGERVRLVSRVSIQMHMDAPPTLQALGLRFSCAGDRIDEAQWDSVVEVLRFVDFGPWYEIEDRWPTQSIESDYERWDRVERDAAAS